MEKKANPQCGICRKFYSSKDDDGSGLCVKCRPSNSQPIINRTRTNNDELVQHGKFGVTNTQMIPAIKKAITEESIENLEELKATYFYIFERSLRYLTKRERQYIVDHL